MTELVIGFLFLSAHWFDTKQKQNEVMDFMHSNGRIKAYETIDKLQKDLYELKYSDRNNSAKKHRKATVVWGLW